MLRVGLTGGIGCGKSTVAAMLRELGVPVMDADPLAHTVIQPGQPGYAEVLAAFGDAFLGPQGSIDRAKLAALVFNDPPRLAALNRIVHPRVEAALDEHLAHLASRGQLLAVVEAALLIDAGYHHRLDRLVIVWCRPEQQRERLLARGLPPSQITLRIAAQMPLEEKRRLATDEINNSGTHLETRAQVALLARELLQSAGVASLPAAAKTNKT